jgi:hypothetical protein
MEHDIIDLRTRLVDQILRKQDESFRWGFNARQAREKPEYLYYSPNFRSTLWTLVALADLKAPPGLAQIDASLDKIRDHFYSPADGIFRLPTSGHFPIPCLNGNLLYLHHAFSRPPSERLERVIAFFAAHQRFDDGDYRTPGSYPYCGNASCYGRHTCYWGVVKLFKGLSFLPRSQRTRTAQDLIERCIDFVLRHEVCFSSRRGDRFLHPDIALLTFPNFYKADFLEILWLLAREGVRDCRISRSLELLRSRRNAAGTWNLDKSPNTVVPLGLKGTPNSFITARANEVLDFYA